MFHAHLLEYQLLSWLRPNWPLKAALILLDKPGMDAVNNIRCIGHNNWSLYTIRCFDLWAWIKTVTLASLIFLPHMLIAETKKEVIDKLEKFEQKNIGNLDPWDVADLFGLTKVRRPSEWTSSKLLSLPVPKSNKQMSCLAEALYLSLIHI